MKPDELRTQEPSELDFQLKELRKRLFELRFKDASEEIQDAKEVQKVRRGIARILTVQNERARAQGTANTPAQEQVNDG
jgi:large subunit ribosomal protein L29